MDEVMKTLRAKLKEKGEPDLGPASAADLNRALAANFPEELVDFYRKWEPEQCIELKQRVWSIEEALEENSDMVPGCVLAPLGFIVFASTICGDSYCVDTNVETSNGRHPIVLFSHEVIEEEMPLSDVIPYRTEVAESLEDFFARFTNGTLNDKPSYG
jgi:hypothetical protein